MIRVFHNAIAIPCPLRASLIRIPFPVNVIGLSSDTSNISRFYSTYKYKGNENVAEKNRTYWWVPSFSFVKWKRGYAEIRQYNSSIDFQEELHSDHFVPKSLYDDTIMKLEEKDRNVGRLERNIGRLECKLELLEDNLTFVRCRAAIEDFEDEFGQKAVIDKPSGLRYSAYTKEVRRQRWVWILKNCTHEYQVQDLLNKINESPHIKDVEDFADGISRGYDQLSKLIKQKVLTPGTGDYHYRYTTANSKSNRAVEVFMDIFEIKKQIVFPKKISK